MLPDWGLCQDFGPLPAPYRQHRREPICHSPQFGNDQSSPARPGPHSRNALLVPLTPYPRTAPPGEKKSKISLATRRGICILFSCANAPHQFPGGAVVAQLTVNQRVVGSNPTRGASKRAGHRAFPGGLICYAPPQEIRSPPTVGAAHIPRRWARTIRGYRQDSCALSDSPIGPPSGAATPPAESRPGSASTPTRSRLRT